MSDISPAPAVERARSTVRRVGDVALTLAAGAGALSLVTAVVFALAGITPLVFTSGSMSPEIPTGSLALARSVPVDELAVGDVVSVLDAQGTRVTHRVVEVGDAGLTLRGDANLSADADTYDVTAADRVMLSVPHAGTALAGATGPPGRGVLVGMSAAVLLALAWPRAGRSPARAEGIAVLAALATVVGVGVGVAQAPEGTSAFWTDSVIGTSTIAVAPPAALDLGCYDNGGMLYAYWSPVDSATSYYVQALGSGGSVADTATVGQSSYLIGASIGRYNSGAALTVGNGSYTVRVTARNASGSTLAVGSTDVVIANGNSSRCA